MKHSGFCHADLRRWAGEAISLLEGAAAQRAGGLPAMVRTVRLCGTAGLVAFSMIGEDRPLHVPQQALTAQKQPVLLWELERPHVTDKVRGCNYSCILHRPRVALP